MAAAKKRLPSDLETVTPPINLDGSRPVPPSPEQATIDADNQQLTDDALAGRIKLPGVNVASGVNPANPYAGEGRDPNWKPPAEKDVAEAAGDAIVDAVPALRTWGAPDEKPKEEAPKGDITFVDRPDGGSSRPAPRIVPAHEVNLVSPERDRREQDAFSHIQSGYIDQRSALEKQKDAEDDVARARIAQNDARAEGDRKVADVADQARWNSEARALEDKQEQNAFRAKMEAFSQDLADDKIQYRTSIPQQITWTIARALGAVQQGLLHLPSNQVADQIDAQIKQSLDLQKANHALKRERLGDMQKFYDLAASQSKDQSERAKLTYGYALEAAKAEAAALANAAGNPLALAEAKKIQAALDEKSAQIETTGEYGTELLAAQAAIRNHKWVQAGVEGGGKPVDSKSVFFDPISKKYYAARNEKSREKLTTSGSNVLETKEAIKNYEEALKKVGKLDKFGNLIGYDTDALADAETAWTVISSSLRKGTNEGTWKKSQEEQILKQLKPPTAFTGNPVTQMRIVQKTVDDLHTANMQVEAANEVDAVPQPYGTAPKSVPTGENYKQPKKVKPSAVGFEPVGAKAKGGDVGDSQPYLVGEQGPELVVPNKPGFVLTALQTAALRGAPPTKQQMDTLPKGTPKSAVQRFAEKMGVARGDGGAVDPDLAREDEVVRKFVEERRSRPATATQPRTPEEQAADDEEARRFMGSPLPSPEEAEWERQKAAAEQRELERQRRLDQEAASAAQKKNLEAEQAARYEEDKRVNPIKAWVTKLAGGYDVRTAEEQAKRDALKKSNAEKLVRAREEWKRTMGSVLPRGWEDTKIEDLVGHRRVLPDLSHRREDGGEVLPLYEPEGKELHQSLDGRAFYASNDTNETSSRPSLSGPTPRFSTHEPVPAERSAQASPPPSPPRPSPRRKLTPEELMRAADAELAKMSATHEARMAEGPAVSARACGGAMRPKGLAASISRDLEKTKRRS